MAPGPSVLGQIIAGPYLFQSWETCIWRPVVEIPRTALSAQSLAEHQEKSSLTWNGKAPNIKGIQKIMDFSGFPYPIFQISLPF